MIEENIRRLRKNAKMSQEDLAEQLSVVRQTVSKWERGLSVPDAEMVIKMAALFEVPVSELLGMETQAAAAPHPAASDVFIQELTEKLAQLNEQLAEKNKAERRMKLVSQKRGVILLLCFAAVIFSANIQNQTLAACAVGVCSIAALLILYKNLALFTDTVADEMHTRALTITTFFNIGMILVVITVTMLTESGVLTLSASGEKIFATAVVAVIIIFSGMISPRLPFNRHTGLRLPWTVRDEATWNVAHRILGITALPVALFYIAAAIVADDHMKTITLCAVAFWIGIPAAVSYIYYQRKMHGRT
ncbi:MAG TPA: XRE family transcriptional regulator [Candidatus Anaerobutyricum stercoripullorum]|uniref:XRE family transcriptional regulator n=1 Tax=Candidatus Anaerobutyricum stercoripullorum TaxID=2838456 RepID=A0A9D1X648_9FIRM|nr:XRE family transcriptional regulator [Candidatus Anaerobutyricum stercoripullorum]